VAAARRPGGATYASSGVDLAAADEVIGRIAALARSTERPGVVGGVGGFGGLFALDRRYEAPVLVATTDGVGTKLLVARATGRWDTVGLDLVAMCVDDLVCVGAEPLFLLDYIATGKVLPERIEAVVAGVADGCRQAGCALLGGETAEHPGAMVDDELDLAGFAVGVVDGVPPLGPAKVRPGDVLVGLASPGLRSNGYTLARHVLLEQAGLDLHGPAWPGATATLADVLLEPSVIYAPAVLGALAAAGGGLHAAAHVTGGGIPGNLVRVLPDGCDAVVRRDWEVPPVFNEIQRLGDVADDEMARVFNLGVGMVLVVAPDAVDTVLASLAAAARPARPVGEVRPGTGRVILT